jgi:hypothetical protein
LRRHRRRFVLLLDQIDVMLGRLSEDVEQSRLREVLSQDDWVMLVGTTTRPIAATYRYDQPFYEQFRVIELKPLSYPECLALWRAEGGSVRGDEGDDRLGERSIEGQAIWHWVGGTPRWLLAWFDIVADQPDGSLELLLRRLFDLGDEGFRAHMAQLADQAQRVLWALALRWDPATADDIALDLRLERGSVSAQLHRLIERGHVDKVSIPGRALGFVLRDRLFNLWALWRNGGHARQVLAGISRLCRALRCFLPNRCGHRLWPRRGRRS